MYNIDHNHHFLILLPVKVCSKVMLLLMGYGEVHEIFGGFSLAHAVTIGQLICYVFLSAKWTSPEVKPFVTIFLGAMKIRTEFYWSTSIQFVM